MILPNFRIFSFTKNILPRKNFFVCSNRSIGISSNDSLASVTIEQKTETRRIRKNLNWKTYGFDFIDQRRDIFYLHATSFFLVCVLFYGCGFLAMFYPDMDDRNWIHREAHIQLRRREVLGLPLVDKNYVDPATIILPPDEEIGDDDIII